MAAVNKRHELIIRNLHSIMSEVRIRSIGQIELLTAMPVEERIKHIEELLNDPEVNVVSAAKAALERLGKNVQSVGANTSVNSSNTAKFGAIGTTMPSPMPSLQEQDEIFSEPKDPTLIDLSKNNDPAFLTDYIKNLTSTRPSGYLAQLLELASNQIDEVAIFALQALFYIKDPRVSSHVLKMLDNSSLSSQRRFLMLKIILETEAKLDPSLLEAALLKEKDVIVKSGLVKVFARNSGSNGKETLEKCLADSDPRVRANTIEVIEELQLSGFEGNVVALLNVNENRVKVNAAKFLIKSGYVKAFYTLKDMLSSQEAWLRDSVVFALGEIGDKNCLALLRVAMQDQNQSIRLSVLKALAHINSTTSRTVLQAACQDPDQVVSQVARSLCEKLKNTPPQQERVIAIKSTELPAPVVPASNKTAPSIGNNFNLPNAGTIQGMNSANQMPQRPTVTMPKIGIPNVGKPLTPPLTVPRPLNPPQGQETAKAVQTASAEVNLNNPTFEKMRSQEIFNRLCSENAEIRNSAIRDIAFVMGNDQIILVKKALSFSDESVRVAAIKILTRRRSPEAKSLLTELIQDSNEEIRSLAQKALAMYN